MDTSCGEHIIATQESLLAYSPSLSTSPNPNHQTNAATKTLPQLPQHNTHLSHNIDDIPRDRPQWTHNHHEIDIEMEHQLEEIPKAPIRARQASSGMGLATIFLFLLFVAMCVGGIYVAVM